MDNNTLSLYHIFTAVAEAESISGAAKELYISQPAVSKAIHKLEYSLGTTLLNRNSRGITLTNEGCILYEYLHNAFETIHAGEDTLQHMNQLGIGHIRIGVSSTLCKHILLPYLKSFLSENPHIQVTIECQSTIHTLQLLENKEIDIGLIAQPDNNKKLNCIPIGKLHDLFAATPQYINSLIEREHITPDQILAHANLILLDKKNVTRKYIDQYLRKWNIETGNCMEVNSMELLIDFAKTGLGVGCIIKQFIDEELQCGQLQTIPLPSHMKEREVCFAYTAGITLSTAAKSFLNHIELPTQS